ncbi:MAG: hypothetical protein C5S52_00045 [ANME-2 cluster archaeon]|nr:hypothetical protein [ANME-2 cluster archaeon]
MKTGWFTESGVAEGLQDPPQTLVFHFPLTMTILMRIWWFSTMQGTDFAMIKQNCL